MKPDLSFPKESRLLVAKDYAGVFDQVTLRISGRFFLLLVKATNHQSGSRLGVIAAKKHAKLAVQRNRLKRLIRESYRERRSVLPAADVVVLIKQGAAQQENLVLRKELQYLWQKLRKQSQPVQDGETQGTQINGH